eukprot:14943750-Ditylum_brightwellii.AAC.1
MTDDEMKGTLDVLFSAFEGRGYEMDLCHKIIPSRFLKGPKWDALQELAGYNYALLQYYNGDLVRSRQIHEQIINSKRLDDFNQDLRSEILNIQTKTKSSAVMGDHKNVPLRVMTCASQHTPELDNLLESAKNIVMDDGSRLDVEVETPLKFPGTFTKVEVLLRRVATMDPKQLVLFIDAYDTLLFPSVSNLPQIYRKGERDNVPYPDPGISQLYDFDGINEDDAFKFLNSGTIIGPAGALFDMAMEVLSYPSVLGSDQRGYTRYFLRHRDQVGLDTEGRGFFTLSGVSETSYIDLIGKHFKNDIHENTKDTSSLPILPAVVHGNGGPRGGKEFYHKLSMVLEGARKSLWVEKLGERAW